MVHGSRFKKPKVGESAYLVIIRRTVFISAWLWLVRSVLTVNWGVTMPVLGDADPRSLAPELLLVALFRGSGLVTNSIVSFCFCRAFWADKGPKPCLDCHFRNTDTVSCRFTWLKDTFKIVKDNKIVLMSRPGRGRVLGTPVHPSHLHNLGCRRTCRTRGCTASGCCTWTGRQSKWLEGSPFHLRCRNSRCHRRISTTEVCSAQNPRM